MDVMKENGRKKKGVMKKTLERCKYFASLMKKKGGVSTLPNDATRKSTSWAFIASPPSKEGNEGSTSCKGCFAVYVGQEKQRFEIKTEYVNHPLFKMLLEEAESVYGYDYEGPLLLPCEVSFFVKVLAEMDSEQIDQLQGGAINLCSPYHLLTPPKMIDINHF